MAKKPTKLKYHFIHFLCVEEKPKTEVYQCLNNRCDTILGYVKWYPVWRQYCFFPEPYIEAVYSIGCLNDIAAFMEQMK